MVSTTFKHESQITIDLPEASTKAPAEKNQPIEIDIDAKGHFYINKQQVVNTQLGTVKLALKKIAGDRKDPPILISADGQTPHQSVVTAMDAAGQLGFIHLSIATKQTPTSSK